MKEKGMWTADDDKRQAYNLDLLTRYMEAYQAAIAEADAKKIEVHIPFSFMYFITPE